MDKVKKAVSIKWIFGVYLVFCCLFAFAGAFAIGFATNDLQEWYSNTHDYPSNTQSYHITVDEGIMHYSFDDGKIVSSSPSRRDIEYFIISYAQVVLIPLWVLGCIMVTGIIFYNKELKKPIDILLSASKKIAENELDFKIEYPKSNELGRLCTAFDDMRSALYESNRRLWRTLEERKRLNSAFSHDLRTPLTVLRGYTDYLEKYLPEGKVDEQKLMSVLDMISGQVTRLEHYTQKMNSVQKLEDITPNGGEITAESLKESFYETGRLICGGKSFLFSFSCEGTHIYLDAELIMQVYENLVANAVRYAESEIKVTCTADEGMLKITVFDDGAGFSPEALRLASQPFFRDDKEQNSSHFGLGLYICKCICEKCGGRLTLCNGEKGGAVTAEFSFKNR